MVQLVEVRQVVGEEGLPKRRDRAEEDKQRDEDVAGRRAEVARQFAPTMARLYGRGCRMGLLP